MLTTTAPVTAPSPPPARTAVADPCGSILSIVTRPTVGTGVCTVRPNHVLVENGWSNTVLTGAGGGDIASYPSSFIRIGTVLSRIEIALTPPTVMRSSVGGSIIGGSSDGAIGVKYEAGYTSKALWGANVQISGPTGTPAFSAGGAQYTANANWGYTLSPVVGLAGTFGFNTLSAFDASGNVRHYAAFIPSMEMTVALSSRSQAFAEYAYFSHAGLGLPGKSVLDAGYQRALSENAQVDIEYGFTPTPNLGQQGHYVGFGLSFMR